jgi:hypothetical protein
MSGFTTGDHQSNQSQVEIALRFWFFAMALKAHRFEDRSHVSFVAKILLPQSISEYDVLRQTEQGCKQTDHHYGVYQRRDRHRSET